jgi:oxygen-dependent protoporphyrinogen oxidase
VAKVLIIGAGIGGLTLGEALQRLGHEPVVLEYSSRPGGNIHSIHKNGFMAEAGPNTIQVAEKETLDWFHELGLKRELVQAQPEAAKRFILRGGQLHPVPMNLMEGLGTHLFTWGGKLRLAGEFLVPAERSKNDESLADFARRRVGSEFLKYALNPMVAGIYAGDPETLSVRHAFPKVWNLERKYGSLIRGAMKVRKKKKGDDASGFKPGSWSLRQGLETLPAYLGTRLDERLKVKATLRELYYKGGRWQAKWDYIDREEEDTFDAFVPTCPAWTMEALPMPEALHDMIAPLFELNYPPVASVVLGYHRDAIRHPLDGFGFLVPEVEGRRILGTLFSSSLFPGRAPRNHVCLTTYVGGMRQSHLADRPKDKIREIVLHELEELLGIEEPPVFENVTVWPRAIPQYEVGYGRILDAVNQAKKTFRGLHFAGNAIGGISVEKTILNAKAVAETIHKDFGGTLDKESEAASAAHASEPPADQARA